MSVTEKQKLLGLLRAIQNLTESSVSVFNLGHDEIMTYPARSAYLCSLICSILEKTARTVWLLLQIIRCRTDLAQITAPIISGSNVIGYIILGEYVRAEEKDIFWQKLSGICREYGLEPAQIAEYAGCVSFCSDAQIQSAAKSWM